MKKSWKKISTNTLLKHPRLTVVEDQVELPDGYTTEYLRFEGLGDFVIVIAAKGDQIALLKEYAYPSDEWIWQLPAGGIGVGEAVIATGIRELQEETGFIASDVVELGVVLAEHRRSSHHGHVLYVPDIAEGVKTEGDPEEQGTEVHWFPITEVYEMVQTGKITHGSTLAALALYFVNFATKPTP